ncbi:hypothetical protein NKJ36_25515 [Mesorhizobium sp. M0142]|uniref:hypothetical protein n=1 Tax=unclassified Mesorhizobium TaxID=325217 RepID=UPI00333A9732
MAESETSLLQLRSGDLWGQLAAVLPCHHPFHIFEDCRDHAAIVIELLAAIFHRHAPLRASKLTSVISCPNVAFQAVLGHLKNAFTRLAKHRHDGDGEIDGEDES